MPDTVRDLIKDAGVTAGVLEPSEEFSGTDVVDALKQLNRILEQLNLDKNFPPYKFREKVTGAGNPITIGNDPSATIQMRRPNIITSVGYVLGGVLNPLRELPEDNFDNYSTMETDVGYPDYYIVRREWPLMSIQLYPQMASNLDIVVTGETSFGEWNLDTNVDLPDGYHAYLEYKLAERLALRYGNISFELLKSEAEEILANVKRVNNKSLLVSKRGAITSKGRYNIYNDSHGGFK